MGKEVSAVAAYPMRALLREIADFIALYETIEEKLVKRGNDLKEKINAAEQQLIHQLTQIQALLVNFQAVMTEAGAARWRIAAKTAKNEAETYVQLLHKTCLEISTALNNGSDQLKQSANQALTSISELAHLFPVSDFKQVTEQSCAQLKTTAISSIQNIGSLAKNFYRKNIIMAVTLTLFIVFLSGLYLNDEWPWEIHQQVVKERIAGQTLLAAWPQLTPAEQQDIMNAAKKTPNLHSLNQA